MIIISSEVNFLRYLYHTKAFKFNPNQNGGIYMQILCKYDDNGYSLGELIDSIISSSIDEAIDNLLLAINKKAC